MSLGERLTRAWLRHPIVAFFRHRRLITFYSQLHALIRAGISLPTAFTQLTQYAPDATMARAWPRWRATCAEATPSPRRCANTARSSMTRTWS